MDGWKGGWMERRMDELRGEWMEVRIDEWMERRLDG
jgi:hypothetical protein